MYLGLRMPTFSGWKAQNEDNALCEKAMGGNEIFFTSNHRCLRSQYLSWNFRAKVRAFKRILFFFFLFFLQRISCKNMPLLQLHVLNRTLRKPIRSDKLYLAKIDNNFLILKLPLCKSRFNACNQSSPWCPNVAFGRTLKIEYLDKNPFYHTMLNAAIFDGSYSLIAIVIAPSSRGSIIRPLRVFFSLFFLPCDLVRAISAWYLYLLYGLEGK